MTENAEIILKYLDKYLEKDGTCYKRLDAIINSPKLENEFSDVEWMAIIDEAWKLAYHKALEDAYLSPEELLELGNINNLKMNLVNKNRLVLNSEILRHYKKLIVLEEQHDLDVHANYSQHYNELKKENVENTLQPEQKEVKSFEFPKLVPPWALKEEQ